MLPPTRAGGAAVHPEPVEAGHAEGLLGVGVVVEVQGRVLEHAVASGPARRGRSAPHSFVLLAQVAAAVGALHHVGWQLL